jgi:hypothetical protein
LQGLRGVMGMGCMGAWLACAARAGVLLAMLVTHGGGRLCCEMGALDLRAACRGAALDE